jgi:hypothetical protein
MCTYIKAVLDLQSCRTVFISLSLLHMDAQQQNNIYNGHFCFVLFRIYSFVSIALKSQGYYSYNLVFPPAKRILKKITD